MATLTQRVATNALYQTAGKALSVVLGAIAFAFMARYLGEDGFGDYTTITTFAIFFSTMADMGLYFIAVRDISKEGANDGKIFGNAFTLRLFTTLFFVLLAPAAAHLFFDYSPIVELGILLAGLSTFFVSLNQILVAVFQKHLRTDQVALAEVVARIVFFGLVALLVTQSVGVLAFVWALVASSLINFVWMFLSSRKFLCFRLRLNSQVWRSILKAAWPIGIVIILNLFYFRFNVIILSALQPAADVGIFGAAYKIIEILIALPAIFVGLVIPILSRYVDEDRRKFADVFRRAFNALIVIAVPIAVGTQFIADWIIALVGGDGFENSARVLQILIVATLAMFLSSLAINTIVVLDKQKLMIWVSSLAAVASIALNLVLIPRLTYFGAAYATLIVEFLIAILTYIIVFRTAKLLPQVAVALKVFLSGVVMGGVLWLLGSSSPLLNILVGGLVYTVTIFGTRAFSLKDFRSFLRLAKER